MRKILMTKSRKVGIIAVAMMVAIIIIVLICFLFSGKSYRAVVNQYIKALYYKADTEAIIELFPDEILKHIREEGEYNFFYEGIEERAQGMQNLDKDYVGKNYKFSYDIIRVKNIDDKDLNAIKDACQYFGISITKAKNIEVQIKTKSDEIETYSKDYIIVVKINSSWYIINDSSLIDYINYFLPIDYDRIPDYYTEKYMFPDIGFSDYMLFPWFD